MTCLFCELLPEKHSKNAMQIIGSLSQSRALIIMVTKSYVIVVTKNVNPSLLRE